MVSGISAISGNSGNHRFYRPELYGANCHWAARLQSHLSHNQEIDILYEPISKKHLTGLGTSKPVFQTNQINGLPALDFSAANSYFRRIEVDGIGVSGSGASTLIMVVNVLNPGSANTDIRLFYTGSSSGTGGSVRGISTNPGVRFNGGNKIFGTPPGTHGTWSIWAFRNVNEATYGNHICLINGAEAGFVSASNSNLVPNIIDQEILIGAGISNSGVIGSFISGKIAEIVYIPFYIQTIMEYHVKCLGRIYSIAVA